jgi:ribonuclease HII
MYPVVKRCAVETKQHARHFSILISKHFMEKKEIDDEEKGSTEKMGRGSKKIKEIADYIKENCIAYSIMYQDEKSIDKHNILNATYDAMHLAIKDTIKTVNTTNTTNTLNNKYLIIVDGNNFKPLTYYDSNSENMKEVDTICVVNGDNTYSAIAAASILAKVERDNYIQELCLQYPKLNEYYGISKNKGYGTKQHMEAIKQYGITQWHRKTFGLCKTADLIDIGN